MTTWLKRLSILSLLGFPIAVIGTRFGIFNFKIGLLVVLLSLLLALVVAIVGIITYFKKRKQDRQTTKIARNAILISAIPLIGIGMVFHGARDLPRIHNISTDTIDPPSFVKVPELRTSEHNPLNYDTNLLAPQQQSAYPNVKTLTVPMSKEQAYKRAREVIDLLGWELVHQDTNLGIIEASETTRLWGFTDDVVIRLKSNQNDNQVDIDLRSVSRIGVSDLGANAKRIEEFLSTF